MPYASEREMYPSVAEWLKKLLSAKFPKRKVEVADTSRIPLKDFIARLGFQRYFKPEWITYDLEVDVTGIIVADNVAELAFVECKVAPLNLAHVSQLLGYSRIALPVFSFLISPKGCSDALISLIKTYSRTDILQYHWEKGRHPRTLILAKWDSQAKTIEASTIFPSSALIVLGSHL